MIKMNKKHRASLTPIFLATILLSAQSPEADATPGAAYYYLTKTAPKEAVNRNIATAPTVSAAIKAGLKDRQIPAFDGCKKQTSITETNPEDLSQEKLDRFNLCLGN